MHTRTLDVALWDYQDAEGRWHRAFYRQQLTVTDEERARGEAAEVFAAEADDDRPTRVATRSVLVDWLTERGGNPDELTSLTKPELWALIDRATNVLTPTDDDQ